MHGIYLLLNVTLSIVKRFIFTTQTRKPSIWPFRIYFFERSAKFHGK